MQTLDNSIIGVTDRIHVPWKGLAKVITPGPGHLVLVTGAPGIGKSAFALWWLLHMPKPGLYLSLDPDMTDQAARTASMLTKTPYNEVVKPDTLAHWQEFFRARRHELPMMVDAELNAPDVDHVVQSFEEFYSEKPSLIVVDNLKDIVKDDTYEAHRSAVRLMMRVAKKHHTVVLLLHHINRASQAGEGNTPPGLSSGQFTGEQDAPFVLSLWQSWGDWGSMLKIRINKNRFGKKGFDIPIMADFERMQFDG